MINEEIFRSNVKKIVSDYIAKQDDEFSGIDPRLLLHIKNYDGDFSAVVDNLRGDTRKFKVFYSEDNRLFLLSVYKQADINIYKEDEL